MKEVKPYHLDRINAKLSSVLNLLRDLRQRIVFLENTDAGREAGIEDLPLPSEEE